MLTWKGSMIVVILNNILLSTPVGRFCARRYVNGRWVSVGDCEGQASLGVEMADLRKAAAAEQRSATVRRLSDAGWKRYGEFFLKRFATGASFDYAQANCSSHGGRVATAVLRDPDVVRYIRDQNVFVENSNSALFANVIKNHQSWDFVQLGGFPWVGFVKNMTNDKWDRWIDGNDMNAQTTRWEDNEPNGNWGDDNCAQIVGIAGNKFKLNDIPCWANLDYLCEVKV